jgi:hypothetical protein
MSALGADASCWAHFINQRSNDDADNLHLSWVDRPYHHHCDDLAIFFPANIHSLSHMVKLACRIGQSFLEK